MEDLETIKQIVARVNAEGEGWESQGTAFLVARDIVITCAHCVGNKEQTEFAKTVSLYFGQWKDPDYTADVIRIEPKRDVAVLQLTRKPPDDVILLRLARNGISDQPWRSYAHRSRQEHDFTGILRDPHGKSYSKPAIRLESKEAERSILSGASGAPVVQNLTIVGLFIKQYLERELGELKAIGNTVFALAFEEIADVLNDADIELLERVPSFALPIARVDSYLRRVRNDFSGLHDVGSYIDVNVREAAADKKQIPSPSEKPQPPGGREGPLYDFVIGESRVLLCGESGSGKTTWLKRIASEAAETTRSTTDGPIPILVELGSFRVKANGFEALLTLIANGSTELGLDEEGVKAIWRTGERKLLFLFDGLNEVGFEYEEECLAALAQFFQKPAHLFVVTSRPGGSVDRLVKAGFKSLETSRLSSYQVREFFGRRGLATLYEDLNDTVRDLARNPFMLRALVDSCSDLPASRLPANIGQLYRTFIDDYIFTKREPQKKTQFYAYEEVKKPILEELAVDMSLKGITKIDVGEAFDQGRLADRLESIETKFRKRRKVMPETWRTEEFVAEIFGNGIIRRNGDSVEFMHQSVQEYFTAIRYVNDVDFIAAMTPKLVTRHIDLKARDPLMDKTHRWWLPAVMLSGLVKDSSGLVQELSDRNAILTAECLAAASQVAPEVRAELSQSWTDLLARSHPRHRWIGCKCLGAARISDTEGVKKLLKIAVDAPSEEYAVQQAAMDALVRIHLGVVVQELVPRVLASSGEQIGALENLFDRLNSRPIVRRLFEQWHRTSDQSLRSKLERLLRAMRRETVTSELRSIIDSASNEAEVVSAAQALLVECESWEQKFAHTLSFPTAVEIRRRLASFRNEIELQNKKLAHLSDPDLVNALNSIRPSTRKAAAVSLRDKPRKAAAMSIVTALIRERIDHIRDSMAEALNSSAGSQEAARILIERLQGANDEYLFSMTKDLENKLEEGSIDIALRQEFEKHQIDISSFSQVERGEQSWIIFSTSPTLDGYLVRIEDERLSVYVEPVRPTVLRALTKTGSHEAAAELLRRLYDSDAALKAIAVELVPEICEPETYRQRRLELLQDPDPEVREAVFRSLLKEGAAAAVTAIGQQLEREDDGNVAEEALRVLSAVSSEQSVRTILNALLSHVRVLQRPRDALYEPTLYEDAWNQYRSPGWGEEIHNHLQGMKAGPLARQVLLDALRNGSDEVRATASFEVGRWLKDEALARQVHSEWQEVQEVLVRLALENADEKVRCSAAMALRWSVTDSCLQSLVQALESRDVSRQNAAAAALGWIDDDSIAPQIAELLKHSAPSTRVAAAVAIGKLKADQFLREAVDCIVFFAKSADVEFQRAAVAAMKDIPGAADAVYAEVSFMYDRNERAQALALIDEIIIAHPDDSVAYFARGWWFESEERWEEAIPDFQRASKLFPGWPDPQHYLARSLSAISNFDEALVYARQAVELAPDNSEYQLSLGWCEFKTRNYEESIRASKKAIEIKSDSLEAMLNLGLAYLATGQEAEGRKASHDAHDLALVLGKDRAIPALEDALQDLEDFTQDVGPNAMTDELRLLLSTTLQSLETKGHMPAGSPT